jgi:hypothetical protein
MLYDIFFVVLFVILFVIAVKKYKSENKTDIVSQINTLNTLNTGGKFVLHKKDNHIYRNRQLKNSLDLSIYNKIHHINDKYVVVDGLVRFDNLLDYTLQYGYMPQIVPELRSITVGGAISGVGIESSSFKYGLVHDSALEYTVLTGNGDILICDKNNNSDLFYGLPNSYGTLGYIINAKIKVIKVKEFVHIKNVHYTDPLKYIREIELFRDPSEYDFIDGTIFAPNSMYISLAKFTDSIPRTCKTSKYVSDIYYHSIKNKTEEYMKIKDYVWRYDSNYFYLGHDNRSNILQNKILRTIFSRFLRSDYLRQIDTHPLTKKLSSYFSNSKNSESIVNDLSIDTKQFPEFLEWYHKNINVYPVWICPYHTQRDTFFQKKDVYSIDFGIGFGVSKYSNHDKDYYKKMIDQKMFDMGRKKGLYSVTTLSKVQFQKLYNPEFIYEKLKNKYDKNGRFPLLCDKILYNT